MTITKSVITAAFLALSTIGFAAEKTPEKVPQKKAAPATGPSLTKLQETYKQTGSVAADFTQEVYQASLARTKTSKGNLKLSKPGLVRWEVAEPEASVMVSDGRKLSYFTPDARGKGKGQVIERKAAELTRQPIFRILTGTAPLDKEFSLKSQEALPEGAGWLVSLKPTKEMNDLALAKIRVNSKYLIEELILENNNGNTTKITLQNQTLGAKLPGALFQFKAPPGTEIVKN